MNLYIINRKEIKVSKWYFGGVSAAGAALFTHPLDLLKVQMQTQTGKNISMIALTRYIIEKQGILGLYSGISASVTRQLTYSTTRFAIYETAKQHISSKDGKAASFKTSVLLAAIGGLAGGIVGNPGDIVNVRMQNDIKMPPEQRRNYKHVFDGVYQICKYEGIGRLWSGASMNCTRSVLMTIGQLSFYDLMKKILLSTPHFSDNFVTHVLASIFAGGAATTLTQPVDVIKTRLMNAKPGEVKGISPLLRNTAKEGPRAFFKGFFPAFVRLTPQTILTFVFLEKLIDSFGKTQVVVEP